MRGIVILLVLTALTFSCSKKSVRQLRSKKIIVRQTDSVETIGNLGKSIKVLYLGTGGLFISNEEKSILIDPYFSNQRFRKIGCALLLGSRIKSKKKSIRLGKERLSRATDTTALSRNVVAVFGAHGHYDHVMDIPYVHKHWLKEIPPVYVNESTMMTFRSVIPNSLVNAERFATTRRLVHSPLEFIDTQGNGLKVYPIIAAHNPHFSNVKLFSGSVVSAPNSFDDPEDKTKIRYWLEGRTLSFLVDLVHADSVVYRIFIQSSSASFPDGLPPESLITQRKVDLAILGAASYKFSKNSYPCSYIDSLAPARLMFVHWEDFFRPYHKKPKTLRKNQIPKLFLNVLRECPRKYDLPAPGVIFEVQY